MGLQDLMNWLDWTMKQRQQQAQREQAVKNLPPQIGGGYTHEGVDVPLMERVNEKWPALYQQLQKPVPPPDQFTGWENNMNPDLYNAIMDVRKNTVQTKEGRIKRML